MIFRWRRSLFAFLFCALLSQAIQQAQAFRAPFPGKVNNLMVRMVESRAARMGLDAADPRIAATVSGMGSAATDLAVDVAVGAVAGTPIGWAGIIAGAIVVGAVTYYMAQDGSAKVQKNDDGTVSALWGLGGANTPLQTGQSVWWQSNTNCYGQAPEGVLACFIAKFPVADGKADGCDAATNNGTLITCYYLKGSSTTKTGVSFQKKTYTGGNCDTGVAQNTTCFTAPAATPQKVHPLVVADGLLDTDATKAADPALMAQTANRLWQDASTKPGYAGLPYSMTDPITAAEADKLRQAQPEAWPTVGDLTAPVAATATAGASPMPGVPLPANGSLASTDPAYTPAPATGTNPNADTGTKIDLGPDPGTPAPTLAQTATATDILTPVFDWLPSLTGPSISVPSGTCPTFSGDVFTWHLTIDKQCDFIEQNRALLSAAMVLAWTVLAALIVLRA